MLSLAYKRKLILGTASLKSNYGLDKNIKLNKKELTKILNFCIKHKISYLDTANNYKLKNFSKYNKNLNKFNIIFKIKIYKEEKKSNIQIEKEIFSLVKNFLSKNKIYKIYCVMLHSENSMCSKKKNEIFQILNKLKRQRLTQKIGLSGYNLNNVTKIIKRFHFDILQFPYNLFDQRINDKKFLNLLRKKNIELHIRSIFLQGIFLLNYKKLPYYFNKWRKSFSKLDEIITKKNINILNLSFSHAFNLKYHNKKIIFGIKSLEQINEIKDIVILKNLKFVKNIKNHDKKLILPYLWKIKKK